MNLKNDELNFLIGLENELGQQEGWTERVLELNALIDRLIERKHTASKRAAQSIAVKRKTDKSYARPYTDKAKKN